MKTIQIEIPDGKKAEWVNGVLTLVDDQPIVYKYKVGDKVLCKDGAEYKIKGLTEANGEPGYNVIGRYGLVLREGLINVAIEPKSIMERIKTFDDACKWCVENGKPEMLRTYSLVFSSLFGPESDLTEGVDDITAYLELRIITTALNEGWEPTGGDAGWMPRWLKSRYCELGAATCHDYLGNYAFKLGLKSEELALYAKVQFADLYADFCGCKKGGE